MIVHNLSDVVSDGQEGERAFLSISGEHIRLENEKKAGRYRYFMIKDVVRILKNAKVV